MGLFPSTYPSVTERGPRGLLQFTRRLLTGSSGRQPGNLLRWAAPAVLSLVPPEALESQRLETPAESNSDSAVGQDTGEGDIRLGVPPEALESQRRRYRPSPLPTCHPNSASRHTSRHLVGRTFKACDELKAEIQAKLVAKRITGYTLIIIASGDLTGQHIVGSCEGNTKRLYTSAREMRRKTPGSSQATATHSALAQVQEAPGPRCGR